jgi:MFS family permease
MWFKEAKYAWFIVSFLWLFGFVGSIGRIVVQYYQGPITQDLEVSRTFLGYVWSVSILIGSLCAPFGGWITDKFGYKMTMIIGTVLGTASTAVILVFPHSVGYFIGFGILGGLAGLGVSTSYVVVNQWFKHHKAKALMIVGSASSIGLAFLTPLFVGNDKWLTWLIAYKISFASGLLLILLIIFLVKEKKNRGVEAVESAAQREDQSGIADTVLPTEIKNKSTLIGLLAALVTSLHNPTLMVVIFALFTCGFSMGTVEMHLMAIQQSAHVSQSMFIASLSILGILELVGGFVFAALLDRMSRSIALSCLYLIRTIAFIILFTHLYLSPVLFTLIFGATYLGAIPGGILLANESTKSKSIGLQTGILLFFHQFGGVVAAIAGGLNYDLFQNYQWLIAINIILSSMACAGYFLVRKQRSTSQIVTAPSS